MQNVSYYAFNLNTFEQNSNYQFYSMSTTLSLNFYIKHKLNKVTKKPSFITSHWDFSKIKLMHEINTHRINSDLLSCWFQCHRSVQHSVRSVITGWMKIEKLHFADLCGWLARTWVLIVCKLKHRLFHIIPTPNQLLLTSHFDFSLLQVKSQVIQLN